MTERIEFLTRRKTGIGGSDVAAIMGFSPWKTPYNVWEDKTSETVAEAENDILHFGNMLEDVVAREFARRNGFEVQRRNQMYHMEGTPLNANIDRYIVGKRAVLECKTCSAFASAKFGESGTDEIPDYYNLQVQHYMYVTGYHECYLAVLIGGNEYRQYSIPYNEAMAKAAADYCCKWWNEYVVPRVAPPATVNDDLTDYYKARFGSTVTASAEVEELIKRVKERRIQLKAQELELEEWKQQIKLFCGENEAVVGLDGKPLVTWKQQKERVVTDWKELAMSFEPSEEQIDEFTTTKRGNRPLLVK